MRISIIESLQLPEEMVKERFETIPECELEIYDSKPETLEETVSRAKNAEIVVLVNSPFPGEVIEKLDNLKMVAVSFTGYDHVDIEVCRKRGVTVCNVPEYSTQSVSELVFGFAISAMRRLVECNTAVREGKTAQGLKGRELYRKKIGVIGTGKIGQRVCELAIAFGMEVLAFSRTEKEDLKKMGVRYLSLEELLRESDIVSIHVPLTKETEHLIGEKELKLMKDGAMLINASRGKVVDTSALVKELNSGRLFACLDVFDMEPPLPRDYPVIHAPNTLLAPHIGYYTEEALQRRLDVTVENIRAFIEGNPVNVVT